jgi:hypothetical protein
MSQPAATYALGPATSFGREEPVDIDIRRLGQEIEARFRDAAAEAVRRAHAAGIPVAILGDDQAVSWLHPDGVIRATRDPVHT